MVDRIQLILKVNNLTASKFADEIGVQRSSISHILSGRNMPSLDLIQKILRRFPEIDSEWLLNGRGTMMKNPSLDLFSIPESEQEPLPASIEKVEKVPENVREEIPLFVEKQEVQPEAMVPEAAENDVKVITPEPVQEKPAEIEFRSDKPQLIKEEIKQEPQKEQPQPAGSDLKIEKIVIFYSNRTFREYFPEREA